MTTHRGTEAPRRALHGYLGVSVSRCVVVSVVLALPVFASVALADSAGSLIAAVKANNPTAVQSLLKQKADVNGAEADGTTALHWAARADNQEMVRVLLRAGASAKKANRYGVTPLQLAAVNG